MTAFVAATPGPARYVPFCAIANEILRRGKDELHVKYPIDDIQFVVNSSRFIKQFLHNQPIPLKRLGVTLLMSYVFVRYTIADMSGRTYSSPAKSSQTRNLVPLMR